MNSFARTTCALLRGAGANSRVIQGSARPVAVAAQQNGSNTLAPEISRRCFALASKKPSKAPIVMEPRYDGRPIFEDDKDGQQWNDDDEDFELAEFFPELPLERVLSGALSVAELHINKSPERFPADALQKLKVLFAAAKRQEDNSMTAFSAYFRSLFTPMLPADSKLNNIMDQVAEHEANDDFFGGLALLLRLDLNADLGTSDDLPSLRATMTPTELEFCDFLESRGNKAEAIVEKVFMHRVATRASEIRAHSERVKKRTLPLDESVPTDGVRFQYSRVPVTHERVFLPENVGRFWTIEESEIARAFPEGGSGRLQRDEFAATKKNSFFLRRPVIDAITLLRQRQSSGFADPADNVGIVFDGPSGGGKSSALMQVVYWARQNGWLAVWIPDAIRWASEGNIKPSLLRAGYWDQPRVADNFLKHMWTLYRHLLQTIPLRTVFEIRAFEWGPDKTLLDLVQFGIEQPRRAGDVCYHFARELRTVTELPVLIAIDNINVAKSGSGYGDPLSIKMHSENLPTERLTTIGNFIDLERHSLCNGAVIAATTQASQYGLTVTQFQESSEKRVTIDVPLFSRAEFSSVWEHYARCKIIPSRVNPMTQDYIHAFTDGRGDEMFKYALRV